MRIDSNTPSSGVIRSDLAVIPAVARVLPGYVQGLARDVGRMLLLVDAGRRADVRRLAHQLRGSGGAYGFADITRLATVVESALDTGVSLDDASADIGALVDLIRRVEGYDPAGETAPERSLAA